MFAPYTGSSLSPPLVRSAGLCCAALLARYGYSVTVLESHYLPGGAAHSFEEQGFHFDAGPSFFAGLSGERRAAQWQQLAHSSLFAYASRPTWGSLRLQTVPAGPPGSSTNPLKQVLDAVGESVPCVTYTQWQVYAPGGRHFPCVADAAAYAAIVRCGAVGCGAVRWGAVRCGAVGCGTALYCRGVQLMFCSRRGEC